MKLYLAGPLYSTAEREFNARLAQLLRQRGHEVWSPQENEDRRASAKQIFDSDVAGIDWADAVIANMDGADPDSGTCWECGYAYKKKRVIVFRTDFRAGDAPDKGPFNFMLTQSADRCLELYLASTEAVASRIAQVLQEFR
jgi:nucleoside 2-deoxyribosyltransferase